MGLFDHKNKTPAEEAAEGVDAIFDAAYREELRSRGRSYFDQIINDNASLFKQDLDATIIQVYAELKQEIGRKIDEQFASYATELKETQNAALKSFNRSVQALQQQNTQMGNDLQKNVNDQETLTINAFEENRARMIEMKDAQDLAMQTLTSSVQSLQEEHAQLSAALKKNIADQEASTVKVFEDNMAKIIEHYLLGALGDQYDLKAQLPSIIQQMEENKQAIVDDMKL